MSRARFGRHFLTLLAVAGIVFTGVTGAGVARADRGNEAPYRVSLSLPQNLREFLTLESNPGVFNVNYHYGHTAPAADGSYQRNVGSSSSNWYVEDQRYGDVDVVAGVLHDDPSLISTGLKMFDFAFDREAADGSFPGSDANSQFHGTAMFLASAGTAMLMLKYWHREPDLADNLPSHIDWEISRLRAAATSLVSRWWSRPGHIDDGGKEERKFEAAIALESVGVLSNDPWLQSRALVYAQAGMRMTEPNGIWTEHGVTSLCCHDSSYQAVGLVYGIRYLTLLGPKAPLYKAVYRTVQLGSRWEFSRTRPDGSVNRSGDDRTGPTCPEQSTTGGCKTVDLDAITNALMRWGLVANDSHFVRRAYYVWLQNWERTPGDSLPAPSLTVGPRQTLSIAQIDYHYPLFVAGTRYQPLEPVKVYFGHQLVGHTIADQIGSFGGHSPVAAIKFTLPQTIKPGAYRITAHGAFGTLRQLTFRVTGSQQRRAVFVRPRTTMSVDQIGWRYPFFVGVTGFQPHESVQIYFGSTLVGSTTCDATGRVGGHSSVPGVRFTPPADSNPGAYRITVKGGQGSDMSTTVTITGPAPKLFVTPHDSMSVKDIVYGWPFFVGAYGFEPNEKVTLYFGSAQVGQTTADDIGYFGGHSTVGPIRFTPPAGTTAGTYALMARGDEGTTLSAAVRITP